MSIRSAAGVFSILIRRSTGHDRWRVRQGAAMIAGCPVRRRVSVGLACLALLARTTAAFAASALAEGEKLFLENKPVEARAFLEEALNEHPDDETIYVYLGIVYEQIGQTDKAITVLKRGLAIASDMKDEMYYNIGNNYFRKQEYSVADEMYANALAANAKLAEAYLNRANARMKLERFEEAASDYSVFLQLRPRDPQRPAIETLIGILREMLAEKDRARREDEQRQRALMNEVLNSLKNASEDARNLSVESLTIKEEEHEVDIED